MLDGVYNRNAFAYYKYSSKMCDFIIQNDTDKLRFVVGNLLETSKIRKQEVKDQNNSNINKQRENLQYYFCSFCT